MRVVFLRSNSINPDPRVEKEAKTLIRIGHSIKVLAWNRNEPTLPRISKILTEGGAGIIERKFIKGSFGKGIFNSFAFIRWQIFLIYWLIKHRKDYDIIHCCDFDTAIPALIMRLFFRKPFVYDVFDYYIHSFRIPKLILPLIFFLDKLILKIADAIIIPDERRFSQIPIPVGKRVEIIYNSPEDNLKDLRISRGDNENRNHGLKIVYIGILVKGRFLLEMIDIVRKYPGWILYIGGFGELEGEIQELSKKYGNIKFLGRISYDKTLKISNEADVLFAIYNPSIPNHKYSSPNKLFEAMMLGKPILVSNGTGMDQLVHEENFGFSVNYESKNEVEEILKTLEKDPILRQRLGLRARKVYEERYSWEIMEKRLWNLYKDLELKYTRNFCKNIIK